MTFNDFMYGGGPSAFMVFLVLITIVTMIVREKASALEIARLNGPLLFMAACLYMFSRGIPHDTTYLLGDFLGAALVVREVGRRVNARLKKRAARDSGRPFA
jgi:hypothetical protein